MKLKNILVGLAVCAFVACSEDKGNYDYTDINEVTVTNVEDGKLYTKIAFVDNLTFDPQIESTFGNTNESDYEYEWKLIPEGEDFDQIEDVEGMTISRERKIDLPVTFDPGKYSGFFIVKDKETGVGWTTRFKLHVKSMTSEGWMVLCDNQGESRMDIVFNVSEEEDLVARDIWNAEDFRAGKPLRLFYNYILGGEVAMLVTDKGTYCLDRKDMHAGEDNNLIWRFGSMPSSIRLTASAMSMWAVDNYWMIVDDKHDMYRLNLSDYGSVFEFPINYSNQERFDAAPFVGVRFDRNYADGVAPGVLYDATNQRFMILRNNAAYPSLITFDNEHLFSPKTGRDMLYMESTDKGIIYALLQDPSTHQVYFYGMKLDGIYTEPENWWEEGEYEEVNTQEYYGEVQGTGVADALFYAFHHEYPYLFYANENSIYQFDMRYPDEPAQEVLTFPGERIKVMKFNPFVAWEAYAPWEDARGYQLVVGTTVDGLPDSECGVMRIYDVPNLMEPLVKKKEFSQLGNIVDIAYKERSR